MSLAIDDFTRVTDGPLVGTGPGWLSTRTFWSTLNGVAIQTDVTGRPAYVIVNQTDVFVEADITIGASNSVGVLARYTNDSNYVYVRVYASRQVAIYQSLAGVTTQLALAPGTPYSSPMRVGLSCIGNVATAYVNRKAVASGTIPSGLLSGVRVGIIASDTTSLHDNFEASLASLNMGTLSASLTLLTGSLSGDFTIPGTISSSLPLLTGNVAGVSTNPGTLSASLPLLTGNVSGVSINAGTLSASLPLLTGNAVGSYKIPGTLSASLPLLTGNALGSYKIQGTLSAYLPLLRGSVSGVSRISGTLSAKLPLLISSISGFAGIRGTLSASLPLLRCSASGISSILGTLSANLPLLTSSIFGLVEVSKRLVWDSTSKHFYETGIDYGVLYLPDLDGVAWNGLVSVKEHPSGGEAKPYYLDGLKVSNISDVEDFVGSIDAFSCPPEFYVCDGLAIVANGLFATQQPRSSFGLCYRTRIGNEIDGTELGYKLHLIYNATASPTSKDNSSINETPTADLLTWDITATPIAIVAHRPTAQLIIDSRKYTPENITILENALYGTASLPPYLPTPVSVMTILAGGLIPS